MISNKLEYSASQRKIESYGKRNQRILLQQEKKKKHKIIEIYNIYYYYYIY